MNKEIKFRGKRIDTGEWVYGHYTEGSNNYHYITNNDGSVWQINPETLGQFTGLKDKDGKDMYEGDNIFCDMFYGNSILPHRGTIIYDEQYLSYATKNNAGITLFHNHDVQSIKVIGNIYDNPELIGQDHE